MPCCAVTSNDCAAPANRSPRRTPRTRCASCGQPVCEPCSSFRNHFGDRVRMCDVCLDDIDPAEAMLRRYHEAGYTAVTVETCRRLVTASQPRSAA